MRMLIDFNLPLEPFNTLVRNGTAGQKIQQILEDIKPEAGYSSWMSPTHPRFQP